LLEWRFVRKRTIHCALLALLVGCATGPRFNSESEVAASDNAEAQRFNARAVNGALLSTSNGLLYVEGEADPFTGIAFSYWSGGRKNSEINCRNGLRISYVVWNEHGRQTSEDRYSEDTGITESFQWYDNGRLEHVWRNRNGKQDGLQEGWYKNGQKEYEWHQTGGKQNGSCVGWYDNGQNDYQGSYADGQKDGQWTWWYKHGRLLGQATYAKGKQDGLRVMWHENGVKSFEEECKMGVRLGRFQQWDSKGRDIASAIYSMRDQHMAIIENAVEVKIFNYPESPTIVSDPENVAKIVSALKLEPTQAPPSGLFFGLAQFTTKDGRTLNVSGNTLRLEAGGAWYLPVPGFLELVANYAKQSHH